jgi:hypothetical protein
MILKHPYQFIGKVFGKRVSAIFSNLNLDIYVSQTWSA